jgi:hypothetical protein
MEKFRCFALRKPFLFGLVLVLLFSLVSTLIYPIHFLFPDTEAG